ncbi:MAG: RsmD family RNA methyltransferase [Cyanobacteria bacterium]|nr:RsmD family RNA methyltransferase [Cyanobacteriota bacterium]
MSLRLSGGRRLQSPPGELARPTAARVRQAVINLLAPDLPGCRWLDLCCGSAVMACEALQWGASQVVAVERDRRIAAVARANLTAVAGGLRRQESTPSIQVVQADVLSWLARPQARTKAMEQRLTAEAVAMPGAAALQSAEVGLQPSTAAGPRAVDAKTPSAAGAAPALTVSDRSQGFDLIYADPPWPADLHAAIAEAVGRGQWLRAGGTLVWECPSERVPEPPSGWRLRDSRRYGGSTVVLLEAD